MMDSSSVVGAKDAMINLRDVIEVERAEVLNADPNTYVKSILGVSGGVLRSSASTDCQLLLKLSFREPVKLRGFKISAPHTSSAHVTSENEQGNEESGPKTIRLFVNNIHLTFADADTLTHTEKLTLSKADLTGEKEVKVKYVKYQHVTSLSISIEDNQDDTEVTVINKLELIGCTIAGMNMAELKKHEHE